MLRIIGSTDTSLDYWVLGTLFLNNYYTVFDMSPHEHYGLNYIQIGIGQANLNFTAATFVDYLSIELDIILFVCLGATLMIILFLGIVFVRHKIFLRQKRRLIDIITRIDDDAFIQECVKMHQKKARKKY